MVTVETLRPPGDYSRDQLVVACRVAALCRTEWRSERFVLAIPPARVPQ